jgi:hypothetical protein
MDQGRKAIYLPAGLRSLDVAAKKLLSSTLATRVRKGYTGKPQRWGERRRASEKENVVNAKRMVVDDSSVGLSREPHVEGSTALLRIPQASLVHFLCSPLRDCTHNCSSAGPHLRAHSPPQTRHLPGASFEPTLAPFGALCVDLS